MHVRMHVRVHVRASASACAYVLVGGVGGVCVCERACVMATRAIFSYCQQTTKEPLEPAPLRTNIKPVTYRTSF